MKKFAGHTPELFLKTRQGFTLLEIIVTVSLIAAIVAIALPRLNNKNNELRATVRKFLVLSRELKSRAKLYNSTYRLVINIGETEDGKPKHEFWVESAHGSVLNDYNPEEPPTLPNADEEKDEKAPPPEFTPDAHVMKQPEVLPSGLLFESVELGSIKEPVTQGIVYIHYLPVGFSDEAVIHLKQGEKVNWSLALEPLTGRMEIIDEYRSLADLRRQQ